MTGGCKVSVVVPVYNPGRFIEPCIRSMLDQTLSPDEFEVVLVDDGSTDETPARLDALAAEHRQFRVIHTPNSGWPGRPRNIGVQSATGEYVQFLDQDDAMPPHALERLHASGVEHGADIVIGKVASNFRGVPQTLFRRTRHNVTLSTAPLIDSLTPHKMFRRAYLLENGIEFPEGRRRLEDQLYMVRAYFAARSVCVLADDIYYLYQRRDDRGNAGSEQIVPEGYYANLREVLDVVVANTEPGAFRDGLLRRFYRSEMLGRLSEPSFPQGSAAYRAELVACVRALTLDLIGEGVDAGLSGIQRLRARLLRSDRADALYELAQRCATVEASGEAQGVRWEESGLALTFSAGLRRKEGAADELVVHRDGRVFLAPWLTDGLANEPIDVTDEVRATKVELSVRERTTGAEWPVASTVEQADGAAGSLPTHAVTGSAVIDPTALVAGKPLPAGTWEIRARVIGAGLDRRVTMRLTPEFDTDRARLPAIVGRAALAATPAVDSDRRLSLTVEGPGALAGAMTPGSIRHHPTDGRRLRAVLPIAATATTERAEVPVVFRWAAGERHVRGILAPVGGFVTVSAPVPKDRPIPRGPLAVAIVLDPTNGAELSLGTAHADGRGRVFLDAAPRLSPLAVAGDRIRTRARTAAGVAARASFPLVRRAFRTLPRPIRAGLRNVVARAAPGMLASWRRRSRRRRPA